MSVPTSQASFPLPFVEKQEPLIVDHPGEWEKKKEKQNVINHHLRSLTPFTSIYDFNHLYCPSSHL